MSEILTIGAGSWGTSFANYLARKGLDVSLWVREQDVFEDIQRRRINSLFLPDIQLEQRLEPVQNLLSAARTARILVFAVPSKYIATIFAELHDSVEGKILVNLSKGFEAATGKTISQLAAGILGQDILEHWITLSGPSFARELAQDHPTAIVAASRSPELREKIQQSFSSPVLRIYSTDDLTGIEVAGSLKNIIAIASGILSGLGYGYNSTASLVTRANVEIARLGLRLGAQTETFWGLAGIGDLMLTSFGPLSRNFQLGVRIARGESLSGVLSSTRTIAEGVETTRAVYQLARKLAIDMPITNEVYNILFRQKKCKEALTELMKRSLKPEWITSSNT